MAIEVPRVRDKANNQEVPLVGYHQLQCPRVINDLPLSRVLKGISTRKYEKAAKGFQRLLGFLKVVCLGFRRVKGYKHFAQLRKAMANLNQMKKKKKAV